MQDYRYYSNELTAEIDKCIDWDNSDVDIPVMSVDIND